MKKYSIIIVLILFSCIQYCKSVTYCYKYSYSVDNNGMKKKLTSVSKLLYLTFSQTKNYCYFSDENGYLINGVEKGYDFVKTTSKGIHCYDDDVLKKKKEDNGSNGYKSAEILAAYMMWEQIGDELRFTSDFSKMNIVKIGSMNNHEPVDVYEKVSVGDIDEDIEIY